MIKLEKDVFEKNGEYWQGDLVDCPWSSVNKVGKAGLEYPEEIVESWGLGGKSKAKKSAPKTKAKKPAEDK
tara:strand:+ start:115 stop:327 length:213 start_codon:yes stop_codon:yes gene_type:complete